MNPQVIFGIVRHLLTMAGGAGIAISDNDLMTAVSSVMTLGGILWSVIEKNKAPKE